MYLYVLVPGQCHASCLWLLHILAKDRPTVSDDGLDTCLVMNVHTNLFACFGKHCLLSDLKSLLASEIKLHTSTLYPFIINECDVLPVWCNEDLPKSPA
jgi:hypothetical protein